MAKIEMYSKDYCPYCDRAKNLFERKGVTPEIFNIQSDPAKQREMLERKPDARTVPQIFIDDVAVGGFDDLNALDKAGKLDKMLGL